jgi:hypothetical protein
MIVYQRETLCSHLNINCSFIGFQNFAAGICTCNCAIDGKLFQTHSSFGINSFCYWYVTGALNWFRRSSEQLQQKPQSSGGNDSNSGKENDPNEPPNDGLHGIFLFVLQCYPWRGNGE